MPQGDPVAFEVSETGSLVYYFDPEKVVEAPVEMWYAPTVAKETIVLESGSVIEKMGTKRAAACGYYTTEKLAKMNYEVIEEPVAYTRKADGTVIFFYDKKTAKRLPLLCVRCGKDIRYKKKLCTSCYEEEMAVRREEGDRLRAASYDMDRKKVLFFDLELTGFYDHDEILSITIIDGNGDMVMDTLVKPEHTKKWTRTEKIHGITPAMVVDSPSLAELTPRIKEIFENADNLIAYGVSTDFSHIKRIYDNEEEVNKLHSKVRCCANEFVRYIHEHRPEIEHASLIDAMECFSIEWDGVPHSSIADTYACRKVWNVLFPNYYRD